MTEGFNKVSSLLDRLPGMERNEDFQTLPYRPGDSHGMTQSDPRYPRGFPDPGYPRFPGESGGGWKMECTPVPSTPRRSTWPGLGVPGNI